MEKYLMPRIRAIKRSKNGRVRRGRSVRDQPEREECSLPLELSCPDEKAFYWLCAGSLIGRQMSSKGMRHGLT